VETVTDLRNFPPRVQPNLRNPADAFRKNFFAGLRAFMETDFPPLRVLEWQRSLIIQDA
jgi:hypothetical protein